MKQEIEMKDMQWAELQDLIPAVIFMLSIHIKVH